MNKWVLLKPEDQPPALAPDDFILLAMTRGVILRVMYRFVKNIRGNIAGYLIHDKTTPVAHDWLNRNPLFQSKQIKQDYQTRLH